MAKTVTARTQTCSRKFPKTSFRPRRKGWKRCSRRKVPRGDDRHAGTRGQRQNRRGRSESLLADKRLNFNVKVTDITAAEARYTPGSCIASNQKSPVWESQPGHNDRRSFRTN